MSVSTTCKNVQDNCGCVSHFSMHFSEWLARGWTVTELPTPSLVRWVAVARVCEDFCGLGYCGTRVRSSVCQTTSTVINGLKGTGSQKSF